MLTNDQIDRIAQSDEITGDARYTFARAVEAFVLNPPKGWITHIPGQACPVAKDTAVFIRCKSGYETPAAFPSNMYFWGISEMFPDDDIVAYRVK